jgi:hypothetical protein
MRAQATRATVTAAKPAGKLPLVATASAIAAASHQRIVDIEPPFRFALTPLKGKDRANLVAIGFGS